MPNYYSVVVYGGLGVANEINRRVHEGYHLVGIYLVPPNPSEGFTMEKFLVVVAREDGQDSS